jgi:hypothetical protein
VTDIEHEGGARREALAKVQTELARLDAKSLQYFLTFLEYLARSDSEHPRDVPVIGLTGFHGSIPATTVRAGIDLIRALDGLDDLEREALSVGLTLGRENPLAHDLNASQGLLNQLLAELYPINEDERET